MGARRGWSGTRGPRRRRGRPRRCSDWRNRRTPVGRQDGECCGRPSKENHRDRGDKRDHDQGHGATGPDGKQAAVIYVPGTQFWAPNPNSPHPMDAFGAVGAAAGKDTPLHHLVREVTATVPPGVPIHFATHSQSSFVALDLVADPYFRSQHNIASVMTTGAGGGNFDIPSNIQVVSARNPIDPVARIGGAPSGAIDVTGTWSDSHPHSSREYANMVARSDSPELSQWWRSTGIDPNSTVTTRVFRGTVAPGASD